VKGGINIMYKKAQSQIITTVLIILLVLAGIVIVWQVVNSTVQSGADQIEAQSGCLGFEMGITNVTATTDTVTLRPNKDIAGYRVYVDGSLVVDAGSTAVTSHGTTTSTDPDNSTDNIATGQEVTTAGLVGSTWCDGVNKETA
tara:strand:- start:73 stop:501 length:429 start_codon:yes stop_codon:yes gene_type:complete